MGDAVNGFGASGLLLTILFDLLFFFMKVPGLHVMKYSMENTARFLKKYRVLEEIKEIQSPEFGLKAVSRTLRRRNNE
ncbi:hypothetical protein [Methanosarcina sp.]|uniref:hypothetical protein n=1 Tax=Methanosarcina sp. TaxID=2213 RepID=UPI003C71DEA2